MDAHGSAAAATNESAFDNSVVRRTVSVWCQEGAIDRLVVSHRLDVDVAAQAVEIPINVSREHPVEVHRQPAETGNIMPRRSRRGELEDERRGSAAHNIQVGLYSRVPCDSDDVDARA